METKEATVDILNDLVQINNDRIEGYDRAIKEAGDENPGPERPVYPLYRRKPQKQNGVGHRNTGFRRRYAPESVPPMTRYTAHGWMLKPYFYRA